MYSQPRCCADVSSSWAMHTQQFITQPTFAHCFLGTLQRSDAIAIQSEHYDAREHEQQNNMDANHLECTRTPHDLCPPVSHNSDNSKHDSFCEVKTVAHFDSCVLLVLRAQRTQPLAVLVCCLNDATSAKVYHASHPQREGTFSMWLQNASIGQFSTRDGLSANNPQSASA